MESMALNLNFWEEKQRNLSKMLEELHSRASFEQTDLENRLESMSASLQTQVEQLLQREKEILFKESQLEFVLIDLEEKKLDVESLESLVYMKCEELEVKQNEYNAIQIKIKAKEAEFNHVKTSMSKAAKKLNLLEKAIDQKSKEAESKSKELDSIQKMLKKFEDVTQLKEKQLNVMQKSFEACSEEYELKKELLKRCQASIDDCDKEFRLKENRLNLIQNSTVECSKKLKLKEKRLDLVQKLKEQSLESLRKLMKQYAYEFEMKEQKWESCVKELELKEELHESKFEELDLMYKKVNNCLVEVEMKERDLALLQGLVEKSSSELEMKERELERRVNKFELAQTEFELIQKSSELGLKQVKLEQLEPGHQSCVTKAKKNLYEATCPVGINEQASQLPPTVCTVYKAPDIAESIQRLIQRGELQMKLEGLEEREKEIVSREKKLEVREAELDSDIGLKRTELEVREAELDSNIGLKRTELEGIEKLIGEQAKVLELNMQHVDSLKSLIQENQKELGVIQKSIAEKESEFDYIRSSIKAGEEKLELIEERIKKKSEEYDSKEKELEGIDKLIEEQAKALELNMQHVDSVKSLIEENREELEFKKEQYDLIQKSIAEKEKEFDSVTRSIKEGEEKLELLEKKMKQKSKEAESKEKELDSIQKTLRGYKDDIELKDRKYNAIRRSIEERKKEIELKEEQLRMCKSSIENCEKEVKLNEEKLDSLQNSIADCSNKLESKQKQLDLVQKDIELNEKTFVSLKKSLDQCAQQFEMKERKFEDYLKLLESKEMFCASMSEELDLIYKKVNEGLKECQLTHMNFSSVQKLVEKRCHALEAKVSQFKKLFDGYELRQRELCLPQKATELRLKEKTDILPSQIKVEQPECIHADNTTSCQQSIAIKGKDLQFILNGHLKRHDMVCGEIFSLLQASPDPAKLVLDALEGFYPLQLSKQNSEFDVNIVRRSCILLLEQLMESSLQINPQVRDEAIKLAGDWKVMMVKDNYLEVLGFLQFLTSYKVAFAFDADELRSLLDIVSQQRQGLELCNVLSTVDEAPVNAKTKQAEDLAVNVVKSSSNLHELSTTQNDIFALLLTSANPAKLVLEHIQECFSQHWKRADAAFEENAMRDYISLFEKLWRSSHKIQPMVKEDARKLAIEWKAKMREKTENHWEVLGFLQFLTTYRLVFSFEDEILKCLETICQHKEPLESCRTLGFADKIPEFVRTLIQKKQLTDAVRLICAFELTDKFSPLPLLMGYMNDLKDYTEANCKGKKPIEEKVKITDEEITALTAVIKCVEDCNLDCEESLIDITKRINLLERMKKDRMRSADTARSKVEQEQQQQQQCQQTWNKRKNIPDQPQGGNNKFPRTTSLMVGPHCPPVFLPVVARPGNFPPNQHAFARGAPPFVLGGGGGNIVSRNAGVFWNAGVHY